MSDYSPEVSSSGQRSTSVLKLKRSLGFNFPNGLSKPSGWKREQLGRIDELYESLKYLSKIKEPAQRQDEGRDLFDVLGPGLWPRDVREARWLKTQEDYPHNLYYNDENDREKLWGYFSEMIEQKRVNHAGHRKKQEPTVNGGDDTESFTAELEDAPDNIVPSRSSRARSGLSTVRTRERTSALSTTRSKTPVLDSTEQEDAKPHPGLESSMSPVASESQGPLAGVNVFLEIKRPHGVPKGGWTVPLEEIDVFTGGRLRQELLDEEALWKGEKIVRVHVRPDERYPGPVVEGVQLEFTCIMREAGRQQTDWEGMIEGLKTFYARTPTARESKLKLRATLVVKTSEIVDLG